MDFATERLNEFGTGRAAFVHLLGNRLTSMIDLTDEQEKAIIDWAQRTPHIVAVRLFGSRARGRAEPHSDVDLAITISGTDARTVWGIYLARGDTWQNELAARLGLKVDLNLYNKPEDATIRDACHECSRLLFPREG